MMFETRDKASRCSDDFRIVNPNGVKRRIRNKEKVEAESTEKWFPTE